MTDGATNFWDLEIWSFVIILSAIFVVLLIANFLIKVIKPLRKALIPSPVLGGFLLLGIFAIFKAIAGNNSAIVSQVSSTLEILTYHCLGIGFVAASLKTRKKSIATDKAAGKKAQKDIFNASLVTVTGYLLQAVIGIIISIGLYFLISCWPASGLLLPMGYGQGPGQAFNWGNIFENYDATASTFGSFANGKAYGLSIAAMGFIAASIGGIIYLNIERRKGNKKMVSRAEGETVEPTLEELTDKNEIPATEAIDKASVQIGIVFLCYAVSFGLIYLISWLCDVSAVKFLINTVKPLFWGFNFIFGTAVAAIFKIIMKKLYKKGAVKKQYTNNYMMDRISGVAFDVMVVAAIGAIDLSAFTHTEFIVPLLSMGIVGGVVTYFYTKHVCNKLYPDYKEESFLAMYGMLTGTASTGIILLREIDPQFRTPACNNMVFQMLWSIALGAPMLLAMGSAATSWTSLIIWTSLFAVFFAVLYIALRRDDIFKKKSVAEPEVAAQQDEQDK